jgi:WD40 repeat protein
MVLFQNTLFAADKTVKIWDVVTGQASVTLNHHQGKVQAVEWNPVESPVLLSGGFDRRVCLVRIFVWCAFLYNLVFTAVYFSGYEKLILECRAMSEQVQKRQRGTAVLRGL